MFVNFTNTNLALSYLFQTGHLMSITKDLPSGVQAVTYEAGHCGTMIRPSDLDPISLTEARIAVSDFLRSAINA